MKSAWSNVSNASTPRSDDERRRDACGSRSTFADHRRQVLLPALRSVAGRDASSRSPRRGAGADGDRGDVGVRRAVDALERARVSRPLRPRHRRLPPTPGTTARPTTWRPTVPLPSFRSEPHLVADAATEAWRADPAERDLVGGLRQPAGEHPGFEPSLHAFESPTSPRFAVVPTTRADPSLRIMSPPTSRSFANLRAQLGRRVIRAVVTESRTCSSGRTARGRSRAIEAGGEGAGARRRARRWRISPMIVP